MSSKEENEILTIEEVAEYLKMNKRSIYKLGKSGMIPCRKVTNKYRFLKEDIRKCVQGEETNLSAKPI